MNTQNYNLNIRPGLGIPPSVWVSQSDVGRPLAFSLYDGVSALTIPSGTVITIHGTKRSGLGFTETCTWSGSVVSIDTTLAMTQESGMVPTELVLTNGTDVIATANFILCIEPSPHSAAVTDGTVEEAVAVETRCQQYAQAAQSAASTAAADAAEAAETAVNALIATIPADYTELSGQVSTNTDDIEQLRADLTPISALASAGLYSGSDLLAPSAEYNGYNANGITYTWNDDKTECTADGTAGGSSFYNVYNDKTALPDGMTAGATYYATCTTTDNRFRMQVMFYDSNQAAISNFYITSDQFFVVPANTAGLVVRIRVPGVFTVSNAKISNMAFYAANDVTADILARLTAYGVCYLRDGVYPVRGLDMPANTALIGCGDASVLWFIDSADGYAIKPSAGCRIEDVKILGGEDAPENVNTVGADLGAKHGIYLYGSRTQPCIIDNCTIMYFNGSAIYGDDNGGSPRGYIIVNRCFIRECMVGINLVESEYNKFTGVVTHKCNHACINNGGNNTFSNVTFHGVVGFYIDGSQSNSGHGTCSACTFNHIDNTNQSATLGGGDAVKIENLTNGFIFDACQFWYGFINLASSRGVKVSNSQFGDAWQHPHITVTGSYPAFFSGCIFHQSPVISDEAGSKFDACYLDSDGSMVTA